MHCYELIIGVLSIHVISAARLRSFLPDGNHDEAVLVSDTDKEYGSLIDSNQVVETQQQKPLASGAGQPVLGEDGLEEPDVVEELEKLKQSQNQAKIEMVKPNKIKPAAGGSAENAKVKPGNAKPEEVGANDVEDGEGKSGSGLNMEAIKAGVICVLFKDCDDALVDSPDRHRDQISETSIKKTHRRFVF